MGLSNEFVACACRQDGTRAEVGFFSRSIDAKRLGTLLHVGRTTGALLAVANLNSLVKRT